MSARGKYVEEGSLAGEGAALYQAEEAKKREEQKLGRKGCVLGWSEAGGKEGG